MSVHIQLRFSVFGAKKKPTARSLLAVGSGDSFKSALLHPIPSSRRHVIRVDIPVPVDVIRVDFWTKVFMKVVNAENNYKLRVVRATVQWKFKIPIDTIDISTGVEVDQEGYVGAAALSRLVLSEVEGSKLDSRP